MPEILKLKISLINFNPQIWREVLISLDNNFEYLHYVIQAVMEWGNYHMHEFPLSEDKFIGDEPPNPQSRRDRSFLKESDVKLKKYLNQKGDSIKYIYDFGDNWDHEIEVIGIFEKEKKQEYPVCVDG